MDAFPDLHKQGCEKLYLYLKLCAPSELIMERPISLRAISNYERTDMVLGQRQGGKMYIFRLCTLNRPRKASTVDI